MAFDVFISYPHEDKAIADAACAKLEADGIRCWIAPRDVAPGANWAGAIVDAIDNCRVMVLIFSSYANQSKQVHREVQQAFDKEKPVIPLRIEDVTPAKALSYYMHSIHWLDALTPPVDDHLQKLVETVRAFSGAKRDEGIRAAQLQAHAEAGHGAGEEQGPAAESVELFSRIKAINKFSVGMIFTYASFFFTVLALFLFSKGNTGAALGVFIAALPLAVLGYGITEEYERFRLLGGIACCILLAVIFGVIAAPAWFLRVDLDQNSLALLGVFIIALAASLFFPQQQAPPRDKASVLILRIIDFFTRRRWTLLLVMVIYAVPMWAIFFDITQSAIWLVGLIVAHVLASAIMFARHPDELRSTPNARRA
jgi:hypothetical protein